MKTLKLSPWNQLKYNHYTSFMKEQTVLFCHRQPITASKYEDFKFLLKKKEWKCTFLDCDIVNMVFKKFKLSHKINGPSIALFGDISHFQEIKLPKQIIPLVIKVENQLIDFNSLSQVENMPHARSHLVHTLETNATQLLSCLTFPMTSLTTGLSSITNKSDK